MHSVDRFKAEDQNEFADVEAKLYKRNKLLFGRDSFCLDKLIHLMAEQDRKTLILWALDCAGETLGRFEEAYPDEPRPRRCLEASDQWARGEIKMQITQHAILGAHAAAKEIDDPAYGALCHAMGHAGATVHTVKHAIGLPMYELTAIVLSCGNRDYREKVLEKIRYYEERLHYWQEHDQKGEREWAAFLRQER